MQLKSNENLVRSSAFGTTRRHGLLRCRGPESPRADGIIAVEFGLTLLVLLPLLFAVGEFYRLSMHDQALARATHVAARAAGSNPSDCEQAVRAAFESVSLARWFFDQDNDGQIGFVSGNGPDGSADQEVRIDITSDDGDISNGVDFSEPQCGVAGSWIRIRAVVPVRSGFALRNVLRQRESWALNQE